MAFPPSDNVHALVSAADCCCPPLGGRVDRCESGVGEALAVPKAIPIRKYIQCPGMVSYVIVPDLNIVLINSSLRSLYLIR